MMLKPNLTCNESDTLFQRYSWVQIMHKFAPAVLQSDRIVSPLWYVLGIIGNPISAKIWCSYRMRKNNSSAVYLTVLGVSDLLFLVLHFLMELDDAWGVSVQHATAYCEVFNCIYFIPQYLSPLLALAFTAERYLAICHPFMKEKVCKVSCAIRISLAVVVISVLLSSTQAFIWTYDAEAGKCNTRLIVNVGRLGSFYSIWTWTTEITVFGVIPLSVLVLNIFVLMEIRRISTKHIVAGSQASVRVGNKTSTATLLWVSFYLIATTLPTTLVYALQNVFHELGDVCLPDAEIAIDPHWNRFFAYLTAKKIIEEICLSHYACNFIIYTLTGVQFTREVRRLFNCSFLGSVNLESTHSRNCRYVTANVRVPLNDVGHEPPTRTSIVTKTVTINITTTV